MHAHEASLEHSAQVCLPSCRLCDSSGGPDCRQEAKLAPCPTDEPQEAAAGAATDGNGSTATAAVGGDGSSGGSSSTGAIVGGVVGGVAAAAAVLTLLLVWRRRRQRRRRRESALPVSVAEVRAGSLTAALSMGWAAGKVWRSCWLPHVWQELRQDPCLPAHLYIRPQAQDKSSYRLPPAGPAAPATNGARPPSPQPLLPSPFAALAAELEPSPTNSASEPTLSVFSERRRPFHKSASAGSLAGKLRGGSGAGAGRGRGYLEGIRHISGEPPPPLSPPAWFAHLGASACFVVRRRRPCAGGRGRPPLLQ